MKITNIDYHNMDWLVKNKSYDFAVKKDQGKSQVSKQFQPKELNIQETKKRVAQELGKKIKQIAQKNYIINISIHKKTKQYVIKVIDPQTKKVIREMPWEKFLDFVAYMIESIQKEQIRHQMEEKRIYQNIRKVK